MQREEGHQRLLWLIIGAIVTVIITAILSPFTDKIWAVMATLGNSPTDSARSVNFEIPMVESV